MCTRAKDRRAAARSEWIVASPVIRGLSHILALRSTLENPRIASAILGFLREARIRGLRKTILGWSESVVSAQHIYL